MTDKTGTLTQNDMIFKKLAMEYAQFDCDSLNEVKMILDESCKNSEGPMGDLDSVESPGDNSTNAESQLITTNKPQSARKRKLRRDQN